MEEEPAEEEEEEVGCQRTGRLPSVTQESRTTSSQSFTLTFDPPGWTSVVGMLLNYPECTETLFVSLLLCAATTPRPPAGWILGLIAKKPLPVRSVSLRPPPSVCRYHLLKRLQGGESFKREEVLPVLCGSIFRVILSDL